MGLTRRLRATLMTLAVLAGLALTTPAQAARIKVETTADQFGGGEKCSLREAIRAANQDTPFGGCSAGNGKDVIRLRAATYRLSRPLVGSDTPGEGDLDITEGVVIRGRSPHDTIVDGNRATTSDRVLEVLDGTVFIRGIQIRDGGDELIAGGGIHSATGSSLNLRNVVVRENLASFGGGVFSEGRTNFTNITVRNNGPALSAGGLALTGPTTKLTSVRILRNEASNMGGGISLSDTTATLVDVVVLRNKIGNQGGGIVQSGGTVSIADSTISGNRTQNNGAGLRVFSSSDGPTTTSLVRVTISNNRADNNSGGIGLEASSSETITVNGRNVTMSGNKAKTSGGGVFVFPGGSSEVNLFNSTITDNTADSDGDTFGQGGGIALFDADAGTVTITRTILAGNQDSTPGSGEPDECYPELESGGHNVVGHTEGCTFDDQPSDQVGASDTAPLDPLLGPLANNGGKTQTHRVLPHSPALDAIPSSDVGCGGKDQRGVPRPRGSGCDVGTYELARCADRLVNRVGTPGRDLLRGTSGNDGFLLFGGRDSATGRDGKDSMCGGGGRDVLKGAAGSDSLVGGQGPDTLNGGPGQDSCIGGPGHDETLNCE
jgi:CSLREA domain-containing protein